MKGKLKHRIERIWDTARTLLFWLVMASIVGVVCGVVGGAFHYAIDEATHLRG